MRRLPTAIAVAVLALGAAACGGSPTAAPSVSPQPPAPAPSAPPDPALGACYNLTYEQAVAPTAAGTPVSCTATHTTETYAVGRLKNVIDGHLVAVDSDQVSAQVAAACPRAVSRYLGGTTEDLRLSMLRPVWFTPTVPQSERGANWYRCDIIGIAAAGHLIQFGRSVKGALGDAKRSEGYKMCGTDKPDAKDFQRVPCLSKHTWQAIATIDLGHGKYPGEKAVNEAGANDCKDAATKHANVGDKGGSVPWSWEYPSADQWAAGQTYGICWAPS